MTDKDPLIGQVIADRYQVLALLGAGGMGRVYLAEHVRMGRKSALKVMSPALAATADAISRFNREAANASRINHPNVAQIYDFGETSDGMLYLAMEYIEGETLTRVIEREGSLSIARAAGIANQAADALSAAHHLGIVHRDLKPENIMLARHIDGSDWVKVVDFGIAKTTQQSGGSQTVTTVGVSLGTPEYMSPEQLAGERLDARSDLYALGLVCFNMLTGDLPYPRVTSRETLVKRLTAKPRSLSDVRPDIAWPEALQAALDRALAPDPKDRFTGVAEFGREVLMATESAPDPDRTVRMQPVTGKAPAKATVPLRGSTKELPANRWPRRALYIAGALAIFLAARAALRGQFLRREVASEVPHAADTTAAPSAAAKSDSGRDSAKAPAAVASQSGAPALPPVDSSPSQPVAVPAPRHLSGASSPARTAATAARSAMSPERPNTDSVAVPSEAPPPAALPVAGRGQPHPWLRANGDSGVARNLDANAPMADRLRAFGEEVQGHLQRANSLLGAGEVRQARQNIMEAASEIRFLREVMPGAPQVGELQQQLRRSVQQAYQRCQALVAGGATVPKGFRCEALVPGLNRGAGQNRRFGQPGQPFGQPPA